MYITSFERLGRRRGRKAGREEGKVQGLKEGLMDGVMEGLKRGRAEGLATGRVEMTRECVLRVLRIRLDYVRNDNVRMQITEMTDVDALMSLHFEALRVDSMEEFRSILKHTVLRLASATPMNESAEADIDWTK